MHVLTQGQWNYIAALVQELIDKERNHSGSGRDGHLGLEDLLPLAETLGIEVTR